MKFKLIQETKCMRNSGKCERKNDRFITSSSLWTVYITENQTVRIGIQEKI